MVLIQTCDRRAERVPARQRIYPQVGVLGSGAGAVQDMPGGHQHTRRNLKHVPTGRRGSSARSTWPPR
jgi:hypothetical protein